MFSCKWLFVMEFVLLISDLSATIQMSCEWIIEFCWYDITLFVKLRKKNLAIIPIKNEIKNLHRKNNKNP